ncbi:MAG: DUF1634 domain-containing protein [Terriglobia bacterium]
MTRIGESWNDKRIEEVVSNLLRAGVIIAASVVLAGGIFYLMRYGRTHPDYSFFHGEPLDFRSLKGILHGAIILRPRGIIQFGLLLLIATPVARVAFSAVAFALERDRLYVVITLIVLGVLLYSLLWARA